MPVGGGLVRGVRVASAPSPGNRTRPAIGPPTLRRDTPRAVESREIGVALADWRTTGDFVGMPDRESANHRRDAPILADSRRSATVNGDGDRTGPLPTRLQQSSRSRQRLFSPRSLRPGYHFGQNGDYPNDWYCRVLTKAPIFRPDSRPRSREPRHVARKDVRGRE